MVRPKPDQPDRLLRLYAPTYCPTSIALSHESLTCSNTSWVEYPLRKPDCLLEKRSCAAKWLATWWKTTLSRTLEKTGKIEIGRKFDNMELWTDFWTSITIAFFQISGNIWNVMLLLISLVRSMAIPFGEALINLVEMLSTPLLYEYSNHKYVYKIHQLQPQLTSYQVHSKKNYCYRNEWSLHKSYENGLRFYVGVWLCSYPNAKQSKYSNCTVNLEEIVIID